MKPTCGDKALIRQRIYEVLGQIRDMGLSLLDLGLVYDVSVDEENNVKIRLGVIAPLCTLCPIPAMNMASIYEAIKAVECTNDVDVELALDPPWTPERMRPEVRERWRSLLMEVAERFGVLDIVKKYGTMADVRVKVKVSMGGGSG